MQVDQEHRSVPQYVLSERAWITVGKLDEPEHDLTFPVGALRLFDGGIVVAESLVRELRYFDEGGAHVATVGGEGEGPGEFGSIRTIGRFGEGRIWAWDPQRRRVQLFDWTGRFTGSISISSWVDVARSLLDGRSRSRVSPYDVHVLDSREVIVKPLFQPTLTASGMVRDTVPLVIFGSDGESWSKLQLLPVTEEWFVHDGIAGQLPFGDRVHVAVGMGVAYITSRHGGVIGRIVPGRRGFDTLDPGIQRRVPSSDDVQAMYDAMAARSKDYADAMPMPDSMPLLSEIKVGASGRVWIREYVAPTDMHQRWIAVQERGEIVAALTLDRDVEVMDLGTDYIIIKVTNQYDVPEIRMHGLVRAPG